MMRANWSEWAVTPSAVFIVDNCKPRFASVTNAAETVVEECLGRYGEKRIIYRDSMGEWGELLHTGIQFRGFAPFGGVVPEREGV